MRVDTKVQMSDMLAEGLYLMMEEKPFEKITIKQICDKTGVIRGTFYNHFIDKYEALEYLVHSMFLGDMDQYKKNRDFYILAKRILNTIYNEQDFFTKCFQIEGQNGFKSMLMNIFNEIFDKVLQETDFVDKNFLCSYYSNSIIFIISEWVNHHYDKSADEVYKICYRLLFNNLNDYIEM